MARRRKKGLKHTVKSIGTGDACPHDGHRMQRRTHGPTWQPKPKQKVYFEWWDVCLKCKHVQHYETAKRFVSSVGGGSGRFQHASDRSPH